VLKYINWFIVWVIASVIVVFATGGISTDNVTVPQMSCESKDMQKVDKPTESVQTKDNFSCGFRLSGLTLISKGIVRNIMIDKNAEPNTISFEVDGQPMTLDYDKTVSRSRIDVQIYNKDGKKVIEEGKYYYIYDWDNFRIVWSQTPKMLDGGLLADLKE